MPKPKKRRRTSGPTLDIAAEVAQAHADLTNAVEQFASEIARLDGREVDTHRLRNILAIVQFSGDFLHLVAQRAFPTAKTSRAHTRTRAKSQN